MGRAVSTPPPHLAAGDVPGDLDTSLEAFLLDRRQQLLVERLLHLSVKAASDALEHLLVQGCNKRPQTYAETFWKRAPRG